MISYHIISYHMILHYVVLNMKLYHITLLHYGVTAVLAATLFVSGPRPRGRVAALRVHVVEWRKDNYSVKLRGT